MAFQSDKPQWWCNSCNINEKGEKTDGKALYEKAEQHAKDNRHDTYFQNWFGRSRFRPVAQQ